MEDKILDTIGEERNFDGIRTSINCDGREQEQSQCMHETDRNVGW